jgi:signal transduction histidine kinase
MLRVRRPTNLGARPRNRVDAATINSIERLGITEKLDPGRLRSLIDVGSLIVSELDLDSVLGIVLDAARELTGARYAALGVLDEQRTELERFLTRGVDEAVERAIGERPRGRGVLGVLTREPTPLRLSRAGDHHASYGFPAGHPPMDSFLGVPVLIRGEAWGNLYLTQKQDGQFDEADEEAIVVLARWAGIAVENARLYQEADQRRGELERAVRGLEATQEIAVAVGADIELNRVLELIVKRSRALVEARSVVILLRDGDELLLAASAGQGRPTHDVRIPVRGSTSGEVMESGRSERISDVPAQLRIAAEQLGVDDAKTAVVVPLTYRAAPLGVLLAFDRGEHASTFTAEDEQALRVFATGAATAVATAQGVQQKRVRDVLAAEDAERRRWARELHDETLQALGGLRVLLAAARRSGDAAVLGNAADLAIEQIEQEITNLRAIITELRPAALDELGLGAALEALFERHRTMNDLAIAAEIVLPERQLGRDELGTEVPAALYRVVQEALTNVAKHAHASTVTVSVRIEDGSLMAAVADDGRGFSVEDAGDSGFGLTGMRERVLSTGGTLVIDSSVSGTVLTARLPLSQEPASSRDGAGTTSRPRLSA